MYERPYIEIGISEQREVQVVLVRESRLARLVQDADAKHRRFTVVEPRQIVPETARFFGTAGGVVFRVEIQHERPASIVGQTMGLTVLIGQGECGCFLSRFDQGHGTSVPGIDNRCRVPIICGALRAMARTNSTTE
jgi:hypothetical protein